jgi:triphosphoribosyl-dephospho-CoA synthase
MVDTPNHSSAAASASPSDGTPTRRPGAPVPATLSIGPAATLACLYEATARKPGNVHPTASFDDDTTYAAFVASAVAIGPVIAHVSQIGVGQTVLDGVRATREAAHTNTNLGTLLLITPLAAVTPDETLTEGIHAVLEALTNDDTRAVYEAIRLASAGGLGRVDEADVFADEPAMLTLVEAMGLAADRDLIARQYTNDFAEVFGGTAAWIEKGLSHGWRLEQAIVHAHIQQIAASPDSLIQRKCGQSVAKEARDRAIVVLKSGSPGDAVYQQAVAELDRWLRADGHCRNPGTTADLIAAGLFVLLREGRLHWNEW